jgi:hypothetical protein
MKFKALVFKEGTEYQEFTWYDDDIHDWVTGSIPDLFSGTATFEDIKAFYPNHNFTDVTLVTVELNIIKAN